MDENNITLEEKIWAQNNFGVPMPYEVNEFCKYYKGMRESEKPTNSKKVLRIKLESNIWPSITGWHSIFLREEKQKYVNYV